MQYPQRGEDGPISLLEEQRHSVATNQGHAVPALGDRHIALLREDILHVRLGEVRRRGESAKGACVPVKMQMLSVFDGHAPGWTAAVYSCISVAA